MTGVAVVLALVCYWKNNVLLAEGCVFNDRASFGFLLAGLLAAGPARPKRKKS